MKKAFLLLLLGSAGFAAVPDGYVVRVDSAVAYLDWGKKSGVQLNDQFEVYRLGPVLKHPVTGEVLGQTEDLIGQGVIETVQEKFSNARILERRKEWKEGDRTRLQATLTSQPTPGVSSAPVAAPSSGIPQQIWVSSPLAGEPRGVAIGDLSGAGHPNVVIAFKDRLEVYEWQGVALQKIASFSDRHASNWVTVDVVTVDHSSHAYVVATWFVDGISRARTLILELSSDTLKQVGQVDGFARALSSTQGPSTVAMQDFALSRELRLRAPQTITWVNGKWKTGPPLAVPHALNDNQLFGYVWGDFDGDHTEDWAVLQNGERLRVFVGDKKWTSDALYGGTKLDVSFNNSVDAVATLYPRLIPVKAPSGHDLLLVPHNDTSLGIHFSRLKLFHGGDVTALEWAGGEMRSIWHVSTSGYLADYAVGSVTTAQHVELWILSEASDQHAILSGYTLP